MYLSEFSFDGNHAPPSQKLFFVIHLYSLCPLNSIQIRGLFWRELGRIYYHSNEDRYYSAAAHIKDETSFHCSMPRRLLHYWPLVYILSEPTKRQFDELQKIREIRS